MSDVHYGIEIEYFVKAGALQNANASVRDLEKSLGGTKHAMGSAAEHFATKFHSAVAGVTDTIASMAVVAGGALAASVATGLTHGVKQGIEAAADYESKILGIGSTLAMLADIPIDQGMTQAQKSVERLRKDAAMLPGEFKDVMAAFSSILPAGLNAGVDMSRIEGLSSRTVAAAAALGVSQITAAHEMAAIIEGRGTSKMPMMAKLGLHSSDLKKMTDEQRFAKVESMVGKLDPALALYQKSFKGLTSTMSDDVTNVFRHASTPLFDTLKGSMARALDYYSSHEDQILASAVSYGQILRHGFEIAEAKALHWGPILVDVAKRFGHELSVGIDYLAPYLHRAEQFAERFAKDPNAMHKIGSGALGLVGLRAGSAAASHGGELLGDLGRFGSMLGSAGVSLGSVAAAGGVSAAAIAALGLGAYGAVNVLTDSTNYWHDSAVASAEHIAVNFGKIAAAGEKTAPILQKVADAYGTYLLAGVELWTGVVARTFEELGKKTELLGGAFDVLRGMFATLNPTKDPDIKNPWEYSGFPKWSDASSRDLDLDTKTPKAPHVTQHITQHNNIRVEGSNDPNRVAKKTVDKLRELARESAAAHNPNAMFSR